MIIYTEIFFVGELDTSDSFELPTRNYNLLDWTLSDASSWTASMHVPLIVAPQGDRYATTQDKWKVQYWFSNMMTMIDVKHGLKGFNTKVQ